MSYGVGRRCGSDLTLLWLWCRPMATAPIRPLAWEHPYAAGAALKRQKKKKKKKRLTEHEAGRPFKWIFLLLHMQAKGFLWNTQALRGEGWHVWHFTCIIFFQQSCEAKWDLHSSQFLKVWSRQRCNNLLKFTYNGRCEIYKEFWFRSGHICHVV